MTCLRALCNHADGKAQVRLAGGIQGAQRELAQRGSMPAHACDRDTNDGWCWGRARQHVLAGTFKVQSLPLPMSPPGAPPSVLARVLVAPGAGPELQRLAVSTLASLAVDADAKVRRRSSARSAHVPVETPLTERRKRPSCLTTSPPSRALHALFQVAVIAHAGSALVASLRGGDPEAAGCAAAALRLAVEDLDARRKFEGIITPGEAVALLGRLPDTPPCYRLA